MPIELTKKYPTLGCCGLDCGLCPSYYSKGASRCPGCCGKKFYEKHPSCSIITCNMKKKLECCGFCQEFPCDKMKIWDSGDSFISHKVCLKNLKSIKDSGIGKFISLQKIRIGFLETLLKGFDDGRSKSFFCLATTLLPIEEIKKAIQIANKSNGEDKTKIVKELLQESANLNKIELKLRKK